MGRVKNAKFWESARYNSEIFMQYYNRLTELSMAMFEWKNLPDTIDERYLELALFSGGKAVFFRDEVIGFLALRCAAGGQLDVYGIPVKRTAYSFGNAKFDLTNENSVIIFNNLIHTNSMLDVEIFAKRLADLDKSVDVNAKAQKTPVLISCEESERLTMKNLYMKYEGNEPFIFSTKGINPNSLKAISTEAPFVADKLYQLKTQVWNEALTYLGISNMNYTKKERMITDEVIRNQGGTIANRYARLEARRKACKQINAMFGLDIWCDYREDFQSVDVNNDTIEGEPNSDGIGGENVEERGDESE